MAKKYYVVRKGRRPGIYESWEECKHQISGFDQARFKGFDDLEQAKEWLVLGEQESYKHHGVEPNGENGSNDGSQTETENENNSIRILGKELTIEDIVACIPQEMINIAIAKYFDERLGVGTNSGREIAYRNSLPQAGQVVVYQRNEQIMA